MQKTAVLRFRLRQFALNGKIDLDGGTLANNTVEFNHSVVQLYSMFDDGQAQAGAADLFGMTFIDAVKSLKNTFLMFRWNADPCISHRENGFVFFDFYGHENRAFSVIVFYGVITEIENDTLEKLSDTADDGGFSAKMYLNAGGFRFRQKRPHGLGCQRIKIGVFPLHTFRAFVQTGQPDYVFYQPD